MGVLQLGNYILKDGNPVAEPDIAKWVAWFTDSKRVIGRDNIGNVNISTVFLGVDHNFAGGGPPVLFETMIFGGEHNQYQKRYCTKEEALIGHKKALDMVKE